jgi:hypothetical protein
MKLTLSLFRLYMFLALVFLCSLMLIKELVGNGAYGFSTNLCLLESMAWLFSCIIQDGETGCLVILLLSLYVSKILLFGVSWPLSCGCLTAAKPAYYNYVCAMLLLNGLSLFGCFLVASGAGFGLWYIQNTIFKFYGNLFTFKSNIWWRPLSLTGYIISQPYAIILFTFPSYMRLS